MITPKKIIESAIKAQSFSKSKYSNYAVGCAISSNNSIILGCNIESKAYPSTMCAERVAIYSAIAQGYSKFDALAVVTKDGSKPCGPCRQIIHEYLGNIPIYISKGDSSDFETHYINDLLPFPFG